MPILAITDFESSPDSRVIEAVESVGGGQIIASDIASTSGVSLSTARKSLAALAALTQGSVAVTAEGTLIYSFPKNVKLVLASKSRQYQIRQILGRLWPKIFGGIRVAFGVILYLQIFIVFASLLFASTSITSSENDRRDGSRRSTNIQANIGLWDLNMAMDILWNPNYQYYNRHLYRNQDIHQRQTNFFQSIFTFVFGDGNPNQFLQDSRLKAAAQLIRRNGGVVIAEQLIPVLDETPPLSFTSDLAESVYVDESFVLSIVSRLGGEPIVSEDGDILYFFPELMITTETSTLADVGLTSNATNSEIKKVLTQMNVDARYCLERSDLIRLLEQTLYTWDDQPPSAVQQSTWPHPIYTEPMPFNHNDMQSNAFAAILGLVSLIGTFKLGQILTNPLLMGYRLPVWYAFVKSILPLLTSYSIAFNAIPLIRFLLNRSQNKKIELDNEERRQWYQRLKDGRSVLMRKLSSAASIRSNLLQLSNDKIVYDSSNDSLWLKSKRDLNQLNDFDQRLSIHDETPNSPD
jgi:hypothetical protein